MKHGLLLLLPLLLFALVCCASDGIAAETDTPTAPATELPETARPGNYRLSGVDYEPVSVTVQTNSANEDDPYLLINTAGALDIFRFADALGELLYYIDISEMIEPSVTLCIVQNYVVSVSPDDVDYTVVADYSIEHPETLKDGSNQTLLQINPYDYGITEDFYFSITDANITDGWGGTIRYFQIDYYRPTVK